MIVVLIAMAAVTAGCSGKSNRSDGGGPPPPPPPPASYTVAVTSVDVVNKDTGQPLVVGGLPAAGGELEVQ
jgi:hypothetical protein